MSVRRLIGEAIVRVARRAGLPALIEALSPTGVTILCYHSIVDGPVPSPLVRRGLHLPVEKFREQMGYLAARCEVVPLREAVNGLDRKARGRRPRVVITFDDGYRNNLELAAPILERQGLPASIFLVSRMLDSSGPFWWDELGLLIAGAERKTLEVPTLGAVDLADGEAPAKLTSELRRRLVSALPEEREELLRPLREVQKVPLSPALIDLLRPLATSEARTFPSLVRFGNHTATHRVVSDLDEPALRWELATGRSELSNAFGDRLDPEVICYPRGIVSNAAASVARTLGIPIGLGLGAQGWTSRARPSSPREALPRVLVGGGHSSARFRLGLAGLVLS